MCHVADIYMTGWNMVENFHLPTQLYADWRWRQRRLMQMLIFLDNQRNQLLPRLLLF